MGLLTCLMSAFNVLFWLLGGAMIGVGVWILVDDSVYDYLIVTGDEVYWQITLYSVISAGAVIFLVGVLGCIGACTANKVVLHLYGFFVVIAVLAEIGAIVVVAIFYADLSGMAYNMQYDVQVGYVSDESSNTLSKAWDRMQLNWECCGSFDYKDYKDSYFAQNSPIKASVPWTCCQLKDDVNPRDATKNDVLNYPGCQAEADAIYPLYRFLNYGGCYYQIEDIMNIAAPVTLGVLSGFVLVQLIGLGMSCALRKKNQGVSPGGKMM